MVTIRRMIDGRKAGSGQFRVGIGVDNSIILATINWADIEEVNEYPIRKEEDAWEALKKGSGFVDPESANETVNQAQLRYHLKDGYYVPVVYYSGENSDGEAKFIAYVDGLE